MFLSLLVHPPPTWSFWLHLPSALHLSDSVPRSQIGSVPNSSSQSPGKTFFFFNFSFMLISNTERRQAHCWLVIARDMDRWFNLLKGGFRSEAVGGQMWQWQLLESGFASVPRLWAALKTHLELQKSKTERGIHRWRDSGRSSQDLHDGIPHRQMSCWARDFKVEGARAQVLVKRSAGDELNLVLICSGLSSRTHLRWNLMKLM